MRLVVPVGFLVFGARERARMRVSLQSTGISAVRGVPVVFYSHPYAKGTLFALFIKGTVRKLVPAMLA